MTENPESHLEIVEQAKINLETAKLPWAELQRFFAAGQVFIVDQSLDLTSVALKISQDKVDEIESLISQQKKIAPVSDEQAIEWVDADAVVWCVVVKPYILVQSVLN